MTVSYVFDTGAFFDLGHFYPGRFPTIWSHIDMLVLKERLWSVKEVYRELDNNCPFEHIMTWAKNNKSIFHKPNDEEQEFVSTIFKVPEFIGLVKRSNILRGLPVADPFVVASAKIHGGIVVTREVFKDKGARIPTVCKKFKVECINVEQLLEIEKLKF